MNLRFIDGDNYDWRCSRGYLSTKTFTLDGRPERMRIITEVVHRGIIPGQKHRYAANVGLVTFSPLMQHALQDGAVSGLAPDRLALDRDILSRYHAGVRYLITKEYDDCLRKLLIRLRRLSDRFQKYPDQFIDISRGLVD